MLGPATIVPDGLEQRSAGTLAKRCQLPAHIVNKHSENTHGYNLYCLIV
jgi:hypothetical protein